jgi:hypothetical protein
LTKIESIQSRIIGRMQDVLTNEQLQHLENVLRYISKFFVMKIAIQRLTILCRTRQYRVLYLPIDHQHRFLPRQKHTFCTNIVRCVYLLSVFPMQHQQRQCT